MFTRQSSSPLTICRVRLGQGGCHTLISDKDGCLRDWGTSHIVKVNGKSKPPKQWPVRPRQVFATNFSPRKRFSLHQDHSPTRFRQQQGRRGSSGAATDYQGITRFIRHGASDLLLRVARRLKVDVFDVPNHLPGLRVNTAQAFGDRGFNVLVLAFARAWNRGNDSFDANHSGRNGVGVRRLGKSNSY